MFEWYTNQKSWVIPIENFSNTYVISMSFVLLAYVLHPAVEDAFKRVRAYYGWRAIENHQTVEVTAYPLATEVLAGRKKWDVARIVALLLASFSLASWGLELQLAIARIDDVVTDVLLRPPPVLTNESVDFWHVISRKELNITVDQDVPNMFDTFSIGFANAMYEVNNESDAIISGNVLVASWTTSVEGMATKLFYNDGDGTAKCERHECFEENPINLTVGENNDVWGTIISCDTGPTKEDGKDSTSPVLILNKTAGDTYLIVEEISTYPSFLYSIWNLTAGNDSSILLHHVFHIYSTARLVEAVVTEIVHASLNNEEPTGGGSFALVRAFSTKYSTYNLRESENRASPFGEHPSGESADLFMSAMENIEEGINISTTALSCCVWILALTLMVIVWSRLVRASTGMDIYDRNELIRAVTLPISANDPEHSCKMRIFVRKEEDESIRVIVSDIQENQSCCAQSFTRQPKIFATNDPEPKNSVNGARGFGDAIVPNGQRTVWLEGVRTGKGRAYPGRKGNYRYPNSIVLTASPVPSRVESIAGTPVPATSADASPPNITSPGIGPGLFERDNSFRESVEHGGDVEMFRTRGSGERKTEPYRKSGSPNPSPSDFFLRFHSASTAAVSNRWSAPPTRESRTRSPDKTSDRSWRQMTDSEGTADEPNHSSKDEEKSETAKNNGVHDCDDELV